MKCKQCGGKGTLTGHKGNDTWTHICPDCQGNQPESRKFPYECDDKECTYYGLDVAEHSSCPENEKNPDPPEESREKPLQPVKNDDERIRDAFESKYKPREDITFFLPENMYIFSGKEKAYHPTTAHVIKQDIILLNARWDVWEDAYYAGFKIRDEEVERLEREIDSAFSLLSMYGVPKERAITISNGIEVLMSRIRKEQNCTNAEIAALRAQIEEMKSCLICDIRKDKYGYKKWSPCLQCENHSNFTVKKGGSDESNNNS